jgi:SAM-dependent methyltransferase
MKKLAKTLIRFLGIPFILSDYFRYKKALKGSSRFSLNIFDFYPQIKDKTIKTGFDRHYVYHTAWAARVVKEIDPKVHVDIASSLYFGAIVSAFIPIEFYDYRPAALVLDNLESKHADLTGLHFETGSIHSLSCMHTVEHVGLGRYGDPIDPEGDIKAAKELSRVLSKGGSLLFVVPIGEKPMVEFNAHRIYTYDAVLKLFPELSLKEFSLIPEYERDGGLIRNADPKQIKGEHYACGCFWFEKK